MGKYDELLEEAKSKAAAYISTAKFYIPKMYNALMKENQNVSPADARDRIEKDCVGIWSKRTILDALPDNTFVAIIHHLYEIKSFARLLSLSKDALYSTCR